MEHILLRDYKRQKLSQSDKGLGIKVTSTTAPGQIIHYALPSQALNEWDEIWIRAVNQSASLVTLTLGWGYTRSEDQITVTLPANASLVEVIPGLVLHGAAPVYAFAATANVIVVHGWVNRYENQR